MRWFKHMSCSQRDPKMVQLIAQKGMAGYGMYWAVLEAIAEQVDEKDTTSAAYPAQHWAKILGTYQGKHAAIFLQCLANLSLISFCTEGNLLRVDMPNILKFRDEYSNRKAKKSGHAPDKVLLDTEQIQIQIKSPPYSPPQKAAKEPAISDGAEFRSASNPISSAERQNMATTWPPSGFRSITIFDEFWNAYPEQMRVGKRAAFGAWQAIENECNGITPQQIIDAIKAQVANGHHFDSLDGKPAIPAPAKWLEQGRWADALKASWAPETLSLEERLRIAAGGEQ